MRNNHNLLVFALALCMTASACTSSTDTQSADTTDAVITSEQTTEVSDEMPDSEQQDDMEAPPDKPDGEQQGDMEAPPDKPDGEQQNDMEAPPDKPDGEQQGDMGTPPEMPNGERPDDMKTPPDKPDGNGGFGGMPGGSSFDTESYTAVNKYTSDTEISGTTLASTGKDENAVLVSDGAKVSLDDTQITRASSDSTGGDNSSFYGIGAAALVTDGTLIISDSTITTDSAGGAGAFSYGDGILYISDTDITTAQSTSGGIHVAGGGTLYAWNVTATTEGESSAAIRSDRGSGTMVVDGGTYISSGVGSPAVYSTADITVNNAVLTANGSEAICIEGLNSIRLFDCNLTGNMQDLSQNDCTWNVILYQSMSGDSQVGNSTFEMVGGSLTAKNGGMFYTTNTESTFVISDVDVTYASENDFFLKCTGNSNQRGWGKSGANGADCTFTAVKQAMNGDIIWDSISELDFYITDGSILTGAAVNDEANAGSGGSGYADFYIDENSKWIVTADSIVTNLYNAGTIVDSQGNTVSIVGTDGTEYVSGTSAYEITVSSYSTNVNLSGASSVDKWETFAVAKP